jgi:hypothetical protein
MVDLKSIANTVGELFKAEASRLNAETIALKLVLLIGGGAAAGAAQFLEAEPSAAFDWPPVLGLQV